MDGYLAEQFARWRPGQLTFEASTSYSMAPEVVGVPDRLADHNPELRVLYLVRDPVRRIESHLVHRYLNGRIGRPSLAEATADPTYVGRSRYWMQLAPYVERLGAEQVHVVVLEELVADPEAVLAALCRFLRLPIPAVIAALPAARGASRFEGATELEAALIRRGIALPDRVRWPLRRRWGRRRPAVVLTSEERDDLRGRFAADVAALEAHLGRSLPWGTTPSSGRDGDPDGEGASGAA